MLDIAIVGGGLSGLALARSLRGRGLSFAVFEARDRWGGRALSVPCPVAGMNVDLGPSWFWPATQPLMNRLVAELALPHFRQHDPGRVLVLSDPDKGPQSIENGPVHGGAHRLDGGISGLIDAIVAELPPKCLKPGHTLAAVRDGGDHVCLDFRRSNAIETVEARKIVLAVPPRLLDEGVRFEPALDEATREAMRGTETWMAHRAKIVFGFAAPLWREAGQSGNAFVKHEQAVLGEVFDACNADGSKAALGGFLALSPDLRASYAAGLPLLMNNQIGQLFGPALEDGAPHFQDWAGEEFTCSSLDRTSPDAEHSGFANPLLRRALWNDRLFLSGAETASQSAGLMEGALEAARRIERALSQSMPAASQAAGCQTNEDRLEIFRAWVAAQRDLAFDGYRNRLNRALALQQRDQLTQQAILGAVEDVFENALEKLEALAFDTEGVAIEQGRSALTPRVQEPFRAFMRDAVDDAAAFNRTSCALSNFPDEHKIPSDYMQAILRDIAAAWREFSLNANRQLLSRRPAPAPAPAPASAMAQD